MLTALRTPVFLVVVVVAAFAIRVGFTIAFRGSLAVVPDTSSGADPYEYDLLARNLAAGKGYELEEGRPTAFRAPGLPFAMAGVYAIFGVYYPAAYLLLAAMGAIGTVGAYLLGRELLGDSAGRVAAVLAAIYPGDIFYCSYPNSEALFAPLLGLGLGLLARHVRTRSRWEVLVAGVLLGAATLTRSFGLLFLPIFGLYLCVLRPRGLQSVLLYAAGFGAVVAPWAARNYSALGGVVLVATNGGSTFYGSNNDLVASQPRHYGDWVSTTKLAGRDVIDAQPDEISHDKMEWRLGIDWVKHNPEKFLFLAPFKIVRTWLPFVDYPSFSRYLVPNLLLTTPFLVLILVGFVRTLATRAGRIAFAIPHLTMLATLVMVVIFWGDPRFRDANLPVLMAYAVAGRWWAGPLRYTYPPPPS